MTGFPRIGQFARAGCCGAKERGHSLVVDLRLRPEMGRGWQV